MRVWAPVPGPEHSGVVRHARGVAARLGEHGLEVTVDLARPSGRHDLTLVPFTDALWGPDIASAAASFETWSRTVPRPLVVTLHDVPGTDPDPARDVRRITGYRRVLAAADRAVVCSEHEAHSLSAAGLTAGRGSGAPRAAGLTAGRDSGEPVTVIPLPLERLPGPGPVPSWADRPSVGVLGFVYPGKGHDAVLRAVAELPAGRPHVVALGAVSPGHEQAGEQLHRTAAELGVELVVTGPLSDADLHAAALATTVPVAAYRTLGASGSLLTWVACGRRPLVTAGPQAAELEGRWPGSVLPVPAGALTPALAAVLASPRTTWLPAAVSGGDVGAAYALVLGSALAGSRQTVAPAR